MGGNNRLKIEGIKFNSLTAIQSTGRFDSAGRALWLFKCDCGVTKELSASYAKRGLTRSCGCLVKDKSYSKTHGMSDTRQYRIWDGMRGRCNREGSDRLCRYGGRGISYDPAWDSFENFWEDMKHGYSESLTLDRINPHSNYSKSNCRWATVKEQARNTGIAKNNKTGFTGFRWDHKPNRKGGYTKYASAHWVDLNGMLRRKNFGVATYGEELAEFLAIECRQHQIDLLNLQGAGYGEKHGQPNYNAGERRE